MANLRELTDAELLSYIINITPELRAEIDLPVQGESITPYGKLISSNERYRNAFINTVNLIGLTFIGRNFWENPWEAFTNRGTLRYGQQVRELLLDLCDVYDYNANSTDVDRFLDNVVPNVFNYIHEVNFQKFYQTTTSLQQMSMAFEGEGSLISFVSDAVGMLYESYKYDKYIADKYMLCRRILDGTLTPSYIAGYANMTPRERVSKMKNVSNLMTFRSPNYNPAGARRATSFDDQIMIINTDFEADMSTEVLATSYFKNEAEFKSKAVLVDGFGNHDTARLSDLLGDAYVEFTDDEITALAAIPAVIISKEWFQDYLYALDNATGKGMATEFFNPTTLKNNHFLHVWAVLSTSPFENATVFTASEPSITSVTVSPATATVSAGLSVQLSATVVTVGYANKAVTWSIPDDADATIDELSGLLVIDADATATDTITVTATSVYDNTVTGTATITIA